MRGRRELPAGCEEEVEIRASTVQVVQKLQVALVARRCSREGGGSGARAPLSVELDWALWNCGEQSLATLPPHHRTRTVFY